jgi:hypothetical protein
LVGVTQEAGEGADEGGVLPSVEHAAGTGEQDVGLARRSGRSGRAGESVVDGQEQGDGYGRSRGGQQSTAAHRVLLGVTRSVRRHSSAGKYG